MLEHYDQFSEVGWIDLGFLATIPNQGKWARIDQHTMSDRILVINLIVDNRKSTPGVQIHFLMSTLVASIMRYHSS